MTSEREEVDKDYQRYRRLWKENGSEILRKTKQDLKDFKKQNNL